MVTPWPGSDRAGAAPSQVFTDLAVLPGAVWLDDRCRAPSWAKACRTAAERRQAKALSVISCSIRLMPWGVKKAAARSRNAAEVAPVSSGKISEWGQPGVVVDQRVDVVVADLDLLVAVAAGGGPAVGFPAPAFGDLADLLDAHVRQFSGPVPFS